MDYNFWYECVMEICNNMEMICIKVTPNMGSRNLNQLKR